MVFTHMSICTHNFTPSNHFHSCICICYVGSNQSGEKTLSRQSDYPVSFQVVVCCWCLNIRRKYLSLFHKIATPERKKEKPIKRLKVVDKGVYACVCVWDDACMCVCCVCMLDYRSFLPLLLETLLCACVCVCVCVCVHVLVYVFVFVFMIVHVCGVCARLLQYHYDEKAL